MSTNKIASFDESFRFKPSSPNMVARPQRDPNALIGGRPVPIVEMTYINGNSQQKEKSIFDFLQTVRNAACQRREGVMKFMMEEIAEQLLASMDHAKLSGEDIETLKKRKAQEAKKILDVMSTEFLEHDVLIELIGSSVKLLSSTPEGIAIKGTDFYDSFPSWQFPYVSSMPNYFFKDKFLNKVLPRNLLDKVLFKKHPFVQYVNEVAKTLGITS